MQRNTKRRKVDEEDKKNDGCKLLIINADDVGYCKERNLGIFECLKGGFISSASVLINMEEENLIHFRELIEEDCRQRQIEFDSEESLFNKLGLHLNLTEGKPISPLSKIKSLVNQKNEFHGKFGFYLEALEKESIKPNEVEIEIQAQIDRFRKIFHNFTPSHIDGHNHTHVISVVTEVLCTVMKKNSIKRVRLPKEFQFDEYEWMRNAGNRTFLQKICDLASICRSQFEKNDIIFNHNFIGLSLMSEFSTLTNYEKVFENNFTSKESSFDIVTELMVHPGYVQSREDPFGDDFSKSELRETEMRNLKSEEFQKLLRKLKIKLISWRDFN